MRRGAAGLALSVLVACAHQTAKPQHTATPFTLPSPPCDHDAQVLQQAQPEMPDNVRVQQAQVAIRVDIAATGRLKKAQIVKSSGIPELDTSALLAADGSTYQPAVNKHCKPVQGTYMFRVTFSGNAYSSPPP